MDTADADRQNKLERFFENVLHDHSKIISARHANLFLEAICVQPDATIIVDRLLRYPCGLKALNVSIRQNLTLEFVNGIATKLLSKLSDPSLAQIDAGAVLCKVLGAILSPRFFWIECINHLKTRSLSPDATRQVAWVLSEAIRMFPSTELGPFILEANDESVMDAILGSKSAEARSFGYKIQSLVKSRADGGEYDRTADGQGPGGRHDNDMQSLRDIQLFPTRDELLCKQPAFIRTAAQVFDLPSLDERRSVYVDHLFRTLREDMVHDFKESTNTAQDKESAHRAFLLPSTRAIGFDTTSFKRRRLQPWALRFKSAIPLPGTEKMSPKDRKTFLENSHGYGKKILPDNSLIALGAGGEIIGFAYVLRNVDELISSSPEVLLRPVEGSIGHILDHILAGNSCDLMQINTPAFAYEPFLHKLQSINPDNSFDAILGEGEGLSVEHPGSHLARLLQEIPDSTDLQSLLRAPKPLTLDDSQQAALLSGLTDRVSLIQGPPGTGKSFIGALIARALYDNLSGPMLVICYTNHALDQFTENVMDAGVPSSSIVRLGSKSSSRTESLLLKNQNFSNKLYKSEWSIVEEAELEMSMLEHKLSNLFRILNQPVHIDELISHLEFMEDDRFYEALRVPESSDGMNTIGSRGKAVGPSYLLKRWLRGSSHTGAYADANALKEDSPWKLPQEARNSLHKTWTRAIRHDQVEELKVCAQRHSRLSKTTRDLHRRKDASFLSSKRIIACTSTGAAMYADILSRVRPETVLVEEAGELLEAHVAAVLGDRVQRLVMIGDHKQLRPKIANYALSVEASHGVDLNRSLFERLVIKGYPHVTLRKQHRMRPEIAGLVRHLTYPQLEDADTTKERPSIRGLQQNVVFVDHREPELELKGLKERMPGSSKQNTFEANLALRYVRYLAQQGYGSDDLVVLTPYLAQLRLLQETMAKENDPVLNDLDNHDLYNAGLVGPTGAKTNGRRVHLSSIDNYQGEEKKIVIVSLTRSNSKGDIGFMAQPERLNVLLSRARDGMIVLGNLSTFTMSRKGGQMWTSLRDYAKEKGFISPGLPVQCQSHPDVKALVLRPADFLTLCPDGGCSKPCMETLSCGQHRCPSKCHILVDHSNKPCNEVVKFKCPEGHQQVRRCQSKSPAGCQTCDALAVKREQTAEAQLDQMLKDEARQRRHDQAMDELDDDLTLIKTQLANSSIERDRAKALENKKKELEKARMQLQKTQSKPFPPTTKPLGMTPGTLPDAADRSVDASSELSETSIHSSSASPASREWQQQKQTDRQDNETIDEMMAMVGLESIKQHVLEIKSQIEVKKGQGANVSGERYHVAFLGNPGTGKTTVARLWAKLLNSLEVIPGDAFEETTGSKLASTGIPAAQKHLDNLVKSGGGVMFVDEAYQLTSGSASGGSQVLDFLLGEIENRRDSIVFVFAGYKQQMESFFGHNPGIPSRVPHRFEFDDYSQSELLTMLQKLFLKRFPSGIRLEDGAGGLYMRIISRRLERRAGMPGFGNMRDLENIFSRICTQQARRIAAERRKGLAPDDLFFTKEDLIGPAPSDAVLRSRAWASLQDLIGLREVKESVQTLVSMLKTNHSRELSEQEPIQVSLNKVFLGSPGTGKTSVAKLYGRLLADIGLLSNGDVVSKTPSDFMGSALGASEQMTTQILDASKGKVLIIDEAYMLNPAQGTEGTSASDPYRTAVIDTIVSKVHSVPGDDRCVLLLGYEEQMEAMLQNTNPGLSRRFPLGDAFRFEDFNDEELRQIFRLKIKGQDLKVTPDGEDVAMSLLSRARNLMNFGNAGDVENLISKGKVNRQKRMGLATNGIFELEAIDFDPDYNRAASASSRLAEMFRDTVGFDKMVAQLRSYQSIANNVKARGLCVEDHVPFNFVFKGPPGTGKTTTARKFGQMYYDMGLLAQAEVVECSVTDLVGQYVGHTGPKTQKLLEKALGKILFVDEAYRLSQGHFATEAVNELTDLLTKPKFKGKLIVILAGYEDEMDRLLSVNPGLASRFPETVIFRSLSASECVDLFAKTLHKNGLACQALDDQESLGRKQISRVFQQLTEMRYWGNGRDVQNMSKKAMRYAFSQASGPEEDLSSIPHEYVLDCLNAELAARQKTERQSQAAPLPLLPQQVQDPKRAPGLPATHIVRTTAAKSPQPEGPEETATVSDKSVAQRDEGVSDAVWAQLQVDKVAAEQHKREDAARSRKSSAQEAAANREVEDAERAAQASNDDNSDDEIAAEKRRRRLASLEEARVRRARLVEERERLKKQAAIQKKLMEMGRCPVGYAWIKQEAGYRCAGGSHFVGNAEVGL